MTGELAGPTEQMNLSLREQSDEELLRDSRVEAFRGPGPGGQKRNKTSSAVRVTHSGTGISVVAGESRSQARNKAVALSRLRHRIAVEVRELVELGTLPDAGVVKVSRRSVDYAKAVGKVMDVMEHVGWSVSEAGKLIGVSTGKLVDFLSGDPVVWAEVNRQRLRAGLRVLNA
jgi:hypothetical protein